MHNIYFLFVLNEINRNVIYKSSRWSILFQIWCHIFFVCTKRYPLDNDPNDSQDTKYCADVHVVDKWWTFPVIDVSWKPAQTKYWLLSDEMLPSVVVFSSMEG